jgi:putative membrane protein
MALLDETARERIAAAITDVERRTSGEIVVAEARASDDYSDLGLAYGAALALVVAALAHIVWPALSVSAVLWLQTAVLIACVLGLRTSPALRALAPTSRLRESVERRAREAFLEHELFATRERTGVLILISDLEHRVAILGDAGIDRYVHAEGWNVHVQRMTAAIREGRAADGICEVTQAIGAVLAEHLPARADDTDELANQVRRQ